MKYFKTKSNPTNKKPKPEAYATEADYIYALAEQQAKKEWNTDKFFLARDYDGSYTIYPAIGGKNKGLTHYVKPDGSKTTAIFQKPVLGTVKERSKKLTAAYLYDLKHHTSFYAELKAKYAQEDNAAFASKIGLY